MRRFKLSVSADQDLRKIADYTSKRWGESQRNLYVTELFDSFGKLAENPNLAVSADYIRNNYRKYTHRSHVIFFRVCNDKDIEIIRVLHSRMDVELHFKNM